MRVPFSPDSSDFFKLRISLAGLLGAGAAVFCVATVLGFFGRFHWFLDLFTHFRLQYFLGLLVCAGIFLLLKMPRTAGVYAGFGLLNAVILPHLLWNPNPISLPSGGTGAGGDLGEVRVLAFNIYAGNEDVEALRNLVNETDPDIIILQEVTPQWVGRIHFLRRDYPHHILAPRPDNFGIGFFSRRPLEELEIIDIAGAGVPAVRAVLPLVGAPEPVTLFATHLLSPVDARQSALRNRQFEALPDLLPSGPAVVLGDLNCTPWNFHFRRLLQRTTLRDSARGQGYPATWPTYNPLMFIPIDHFLHTPELQVLRRDVLPGAGSDHLPLLVEFAPVP